MRSEDPSRKRRGPSADFLTFCMVFPDFVPVFDDISETLYLMVFVGAIFWGKNVVFRGSQSLSGLLGGSGDSGRSWRESGSAERIIKVGFFREVEDRLKTTKEGGSEGRTIMEKDQNWEPKAR